MDVALASKTLYKGFDWSTVDTDDVIKLHAFLEASSAKWNTVRTSLYNLLKNEHPMASDFAKDLRNALKQRFLQMHDPVDAEVNERVRRSEMNAGPNGTSAGQNTANNVQSRRGFR